MEDFSLETTWRDRLKSLGWSQRALEQIQLCRAKNTMIGYNRVIRDLVSFCSHNGYVYPPSQGNTGLFADFMCQVADRSTRPLSLLKTTTAAISCLYEALGEPSPMEDGLLHRLSSALVKSGTSVPAKRTGVMPAKAFTDMFDSWDDDEKLSMKRLRLKVITLMALAFMARPSDLAPVAEHFDPSSTKNTAYVLTRDQVEFHDDQSMTVTFFGTKNDTSRSGFEIRIPGSDETKVNVVGSLKSYMQRTQTLVGEDNAVFLALNAPHKVLRAEGVRKVLTESISLAGLDGQGFTPRCFRPTGANAAMEAGCTPEAAMQIGRWKTKEVFLNHYVYPMAPQNFTKEVAQFSGLSYDK